MHQFLSVKKQAKQEKTESVKMNLKNICLQRQDPLKNVMDYDPYDYSYQNLDYREKELFDIIKLKYLPKDLNGGLNERFS